MKRPLKLLLAVLIALTLVSALIPAVVAETDVSVAESVSADAAEPGGDVLTTGTTETKKAGFAERLSQWFIDHLGGKVGNEIICFIISLFPILELRGGLIAAVVMNVNFIKAFIICYIANMIPIPFILLFIRKIFAWMKKFKKLQPLVNKLEAKGVKNREKVLKYETWGLLAFVAIPLPGTGGWTGALIAAMLDLDFKKSLLVIALGVLIAGVIMSLITYGPQAIINMTKTADDAAQAAMLLLAR